MLTLGRAVPGTGRRDAIITTSLDGRILFWSPGARALLGYREREIAGRHFHRMLPEKYRKLDCLNVAEVLEGRTVRNIVVKHLHADGTLLRCLQTMVPIRDGSGRIVAALRIVLDLSSTLEARQALQYHLAQLEEIAGDPSLRGGRTGPVSAAARYYRQERLQTLQEYLRVVEGEADQIQMLLDRLRGRVGQLDDVLMGSASALAEELEEGA